MSVIDDPRYRRLIAERNALTWLSMISPFISVEPVETQPGWPPDEYLITYTCKGISGIDGDGNPVYSEEHKVALRFSEHFPIQEPDFLWLTNIWHPNIEHKEPRHVCTNAPKSWWAGKKTAEIVRLLGEMVQYKRYHATQDEELQPADEEVAKWVREYAEPNNIIGPDNPVDPRPLIDLYLHTDSPEVEAARVETAAFEAEAEGAKARAVPAVAAKVADVGVAHAKPAGVEFGEVVALDDSQFEVVDGPTFGGAEG
jgi:ubiquitin-protein ligase